KGHELLNKIDVDNSVFIDISQDPSDFMLQLAECENVIASAMHALITADSLGIPNVRMTTKESGVGDYKFEDYYSAFGINEHEIVNLNERNFVNKDLSSIKDGYKIQPEILKKIQHDLIECFPVKNDKYLEFKKKHQGF
ncbi:MAG: polysaccharide pyruvyl transferase family protein, partial [Shewanella sp.]